MCLRFAFHVSHLCFAFFPPSAVLIAAWRIMSQSENEYIIVFFFCVFPFCFVSVSHDSRATHCKKKRVRRVGPPTPSAHSPDSESKLASSVCMRELNERIFASWISECLAFYTFHLRHANSMKFDSQTEHQRATLVCDARVTVGWKVCLYTSSTWMLFRFNPSRFHHGCTRSNKNKSPAQTKHRL